MKSRLLSGAFCALAILATPLSAQSDVREVQIPTEKGEAEKIKAELAACEEFGCFQKIFAKNHARMIESLGTITELAPEVTPAQCRERRTFIDLYHCVNDRLKTSRTFDGGDPEDRAIATALQAYWHAFMNNSIYVKACAERFGRAACLWEGENVNAVFDGLAKRRDPHGPSKAESPRIDWGGLAQTGDINETYLASLRNCLNACVPGPACDATGGQPTAARSVDPSFADVCASVSKLEPITKNLGLTGDRALDYVNRIRVEALREHWAEVRAITGHEPKGFFTRHPACRRLRPMFDDTNQNVPLPVREKPSSDDRPSLNALEEQTARFCIDDPDPAKGVTFLVLLQMSPFTKRVLAEPSSPFPVVDACFRNAMKSNANASRQGAMALGAFCLGISFTKSIPLNLVCNVEVSILAKLALDVAEDQYKVCTDSGKVKGKDGPCGPETARLLLANLRYQRFISYLTIASAGMSTAVIARRDLSSFKFASAAMLAKLDKIKRLLELNTSTATIEKALMNADRIDASVMSIAGKGADHGGKFTTVADRASAFQSTVAPGQSMSTLTTAVDRAYEELFGKEN